MGDKTSGHHLTGRTIASIAMQLVVRDFDLVDRLGGVLATHEAFSVHYVRWDVDPDNPSWPQVRASAIRAAIDKGRDYAEALDGTLVRVDHIADVGLLGGEGSAYARAVPLGGMPSPGALPDVPSLDPVPQELVAIIDARFVADVAAL